MKLRNSNTTYIETTLVQHNINHGVWIDIFPIDGMSKNNVKEKALNLSTMVAFYLLFWVILEKTTFKTLWRDIIVILFLLFFT